MPIIPSWKYVGVQWQCPVMHRENAGSVISVSEILFIEMFNHKLHFQKTHTTMYVYLTG